MFLEITVVVVAAAAAIVSYARPARDGACVVVSRCDGKGQGLDASAPFRMGTVDWRVT